jgi:FlaA1/EpsC-like NDP-sugar epimerase
MLSVFVKIYGNLSSVTMQEDFKNFMNLKKDEFDQLSHKNRFIFYGAGMSCKKILRCFSELNILLPEAIWDKDIEKTGKNLFGVKIVQPDFKSLRNCKDILFVITIESENITDDIIQEFNEQGFAGYMTRKHIIREVARLLWLQWSNKWN